MHYRLYKARKIMTVSERLALVRKEAGLILTDFSKKLGVSRRAYIYYENGERDVPISVVLKLEEDFDILSTWLLTGKGPKTSDIRDQNLLSALEVTDAFITKNKLKLKPNEAAELVYMLWELFNEGVPQDSPKVKRILENTL